MDLKKYYPIGIAIAIFFSISALYFLPSISGKKVQQHDVISYEAASKEANDYRAENGEEPLWTGKMFSGMPTYFISFISDGNIIAKLDTVFKLFNTGPIGRFFLLMIGFYFLMRVMGVEHWLAVVGGVLYGFSSYFIILVDAGHNTKLSAIAYMAPVLGAVFLTYRNKMLLGAALIALFVSLEISANHIQMTYYLMIIIAFAILSKLIFAIQHKQLNQFFKATAVVVIAAVIGVLPNTTKLWTNYDGAKETIRGGSSELTPIDKVDNEEKSNGLDIDYAFQWSYGITETSTLIFPKAFGGASSESLDKNSETFKALKKAGLPTSQAKKVVEGGMPTYWGKQPFTSGPTFIGALSVFLFVVGLFVLDRKHKYWILGALILTIPLSWGKNFLWLNEWFFNNVPLYNKFRAPSMILVVAELLIPVAAILTLNKIIQVKNGESFSGGLIYKLFNKQFKSDDSIYKLTTFLYIPIYLMLSICLFFAFYPDLIFDFVGSGDTQFKSQLLSSGFPEASAQNVIDALMLDRKSMLTSNAWFAAFIVAAVGFSIVFYLKGTIQKNILIMVVAVFGVFELVNLDLDYLNHDDFVSSREYDNKFDATPADQQILNQDGYFRVLNLSVSTFNDATTSYHHHSVGGYSAAKLQRYQDLIERQISKNNQKVWSMLNTKYIIQNPNQASQFPNNGPLWNIKKLNWVKNADEEMNALNDFDVLGDVFIDERFKDLYTNWSFSYDSLAQLSLVKYDPKIMEYKISSTKDQIVVFSEIYYKGNEDWKAYIDGEYIDHFRCNYVLRGLKVPAGEHTIEFKFEPQTYYSGEKISYAGSFLLLALLGFALYREKKGLNPA